jgi:phytoene dehydrogenase-like protein
MALKRLQAAVRGTSNVSAGLASSTALWSSWAQIAIEHEAEAIDARNRLVRQRESGQDWYMNPELHASIVAITASSFAIDGFYGAVSQWIKIPHDVRDSWDANRTARHARIFENPQARIRPWLADAVLARRAEVAIRIPRRECSLRGGIS